MDARHSSRLFGIAWLVLPVVLSIAVAPLGGGASDALAQSSPRTFPAHATTEQEQDLVIAVGNTLYAARSCYERAVGRRFGAWRRFRSVSLRLDANGQALGIVVSPARSAAASRLRRCLLPLIGRWRIPSARPAQEVTFRSMAFEHAVFQIQD